MSSVNAIQRLDLKKVRASITRPANATAYAAGDVVAAADDSHLTLADVTKPGSSPYTSRILSANAFSSVAAGTLPDLELWLFSSDIVEVGDNVAFAPSDTELLTCLGVIDFPVADWKSAVNGAGCFKRNLEVAIQAGPDIYGVLVVRNAYTPSEWEIITVDLMVAYN